MAIEDIPETLQFDTSNQCTPGIDENCCETIIPPSFLAPEDSSCWKWWTTPGDGTPTSGLPDPPKGCNYKPCQDAVCAFDSCCCDVAWDLSCRGYEMQSGDTVENNYFVDGCSAKILCCEQESEFLDPPQAILPPVPAPAPATFEPVLVEISPDSSSSSSSSSSSAVTIVIPQPANVIPTSSAQVLASIYAVNPGGMTEIDVISSEQAISSNFVTTNIDVSSNTISEEIITSIGQNGQVVIEETELISTAKGKSGVKCKSGAKGKSGSKGKSGAKGKSSSKGKSGVRGKSGGAKSSTATKGKSDGNLPS